MRAAAFLRYAAVSGTCLLLHNVCMIVADHYGCTLTMAIGISYTIVVIIGYLLHSLFTFRRAIGWREFGRYALAMATNVPFAWATTWFWHDPIRLPMLYAAPLASASMVAVNFLLSQWAIAGRWPGLAGSRFRPQA